MEILIMFNIINIKLTYIILKMPENFSAMKQYLESHLTIIFA